MFDAGKTLTLKCKLIYASHDLTNYSNFNTHKFNLKAMSSDTKEVKGTLPNIWNLSPVSGVTWMT